MEGIRRTPAPGDPRPVGGGKGSLLRQNGDLTYEQIAEMRHCPVGTVKTNDSALGKLRKFLA